MKIKIADFLRQNFEGADSIGNIDSEYIGQKQFIGKPRFMISEGRTFCLCGGECLIAFQVGDNFHIRGSVFLVHDDNDGSRWDAQRQRGENNLGPRPSPALRLVYSV